MIKTVTKQCNAFLPKQSSSGTEMMNQMETFKNNNKYPNLPHKMKLRALLNSYPDWKFLHSLAQRIESIGNLSLKQLNAIDKAFNALMWRKKGEKHIY